MIMMMMMMIMMNNYIIISVCLSLSLLTLPLLQPMNGPALNWSRAREGKRVNNQLILAI